MNKALLESQYEIQDWSKIQLFTMPTPNGVKISIALEELGLPYEAHRINIMEGAQNTEAYRTLSPNGKIPALIDPDGPNGEPLVLMESGAILMHLADKTGKLISEDPVLRSQCIQWLFFQVGHIGPMFGQFGHFYKFATKKCDHPYPTERYSNETQRLLGVLDKQLEGRDYLIEEYSIADIAIFPWVNGLVTFYAAGEKLGFDRFTNVKAWLERCIARPAYERGSKVGAAS